MIAVQIILIAIGASLADAHECNCDCGSKLVCEVQKTLRTELDENTDEIAKWNKHYNFVRNFSEDWENQVTQIVRREMEVELNIAIEDIKKEFEDSQREVSIKVEEQTARLESFENSLRTLNERVDKLDVNMQNISDEMIAIKAECKCQATQEKPKCGVVDNNAPAGSVWPWMAAVYKNGNEYGCDGAIIHPHFVLTSAWCMSYFGSNGLSVKLGLSDMRRGIFLQEHEVKAVTTHSRFRGGSGRGDNHDYDIALLELKEPIEFGPSVSPVCLPPTEASEDDPFYKPQSIARAVVLKGNTAGPPMSQDAAPRTLNFTILPQSECRRRLKEARLERIHPDPELSFCAESSSTECPKEGSPMVQSRLEGEDGTRKWTQVGLRSWHLNCKTFFIPRVDHLRTWVQNIIAASSTQ